MSAPPASTHDDIMAALLRQHELMDRLAANIDRFAAQDGHIAELTAAVGRLSAQAEQTDRLLERLVAPRQPTPEIIELRRIAQGVDRLVVLAGPTPGPGGGAPPAGPAPAQRVDEFLQTKAALELADRRELTLDAIAARAGLDANSLSVGQRKHIGKAAQLGGFVPLRIGDAPLCYVRRQVAEELKLVGGAR